MKKLLIIVICIALSHAVFAQAGARPMSTADLRGIYVYSEHLAKDSLPLLQSLSIPGIDGITLLQGWNSIEPTKGKYRWSTFDYWVGEAVSKGKKIILAIRAGQDTPPWLFEPLPSGGGAMPLGFNVSPRQGIGQTTCDSETIAAPWDTAFLNEWDQMLSTVAAHLKKNGTYDNFVSIRLTGINRTTSELRLPEEILTSPCTTNSIMTWLHAADPYRPSKLLNAWDLVTNSFQKYFPDKIFGVEVVPNSTGNNSYAFPEINDNGCVYSAVVPAKDVPGACLVSDTLSEQNEPLVKLAAQKFSGRLSVSFQNLDLTEPANSYIVQTAKMYGTMIGYQTNDYNQLEKAACPGGACDSASYLALLEVGIYPLGKTNSLRAQYIEVLPPDAMSFPSAILSAHNEIFKSSDVPNLLPKAQFLQSFPNPFSENTSIKFSSPDHNFAQVTIHNLLGSEVARLFTGSLDGGEHAFTWDARGMSQGMYICILRASGRTQELPLMLVK